MPTAMRLCGFQPQVGFSLQRHQCGMIDSRNLAVALLNVLCVVSGSLNPFGAVSVLGNSWQSLWTLLRMICEMHKTDHARLQRKPLFIKMCFLKKEGEAVSFEGEHGGGSVDGLEAGKGRREMK